MLSRCGGPSLSFDAKCSLFLTLVTLQRFCARASLFRSEKVMRIMSSNIYIQPITTTESWSFLKNKTKKQHPCSELFLKVSLLLIWFIVCRFSSISHFKYHILNDLKIRIIVINALCLPLRMWRHPHKSSHCRSAQTHEERKQKPSADSWMGCCRCWESKPKAKSGNLDSKLGSSASAAFTHHSARTLSTLNDPHWNLTPA